MEPYVVTVRLFAGLREAARRESLTVSLPPGATVALLRQRLAECEPVLASWISRCAVAVNYEYLADEQVLPANAEVALIPPVSGGTACGGPT